MVKMVSQIEFGVDVSVDFNSLVACPGIVMSQMTDFDESRITFHNKTQLPNTPQLL